MCDLSFEKSNIKVVGGQNFKDITHYKVVIYLAPTQTIVVRPNLLLAPETFSNWTDRRIHVDDVISVLTIDILSCYSDVRLLISTTMSVSETRRRIQCNEDPIKSHFTNS